jgi:hypothetical protein
VTFNTDPPYSVTGAITGKGTNGYSRTGNVELGVFCFDSVDIQSGATVNVTGSRGLVLLSRGAFSLDTALRVSAAPGTNTTTAAGAAGSGGSSGGAWAANGSGLGAGRGGNTGGGAGYAGSGGNGSGGELGGSAYGNAQLDDLYGGSGGGGGGALGTGGGGGAGAIEIVARTQISLGANAVIEARGQSTDDTTGSGNDSIGGGGSGGAILLASPRLVLNSAAGSVSVRGGDALSGSPDPNGGGGSGGRVAFYSGETYGTAPTQVDLTAGQAVPSGRNGALGSFYDGDTPDFLKEQPGTVFMFR